MQHHVSVKMYMIMYIWREGTHPDPACDRKTVDSVQLSIILHGFNPRPNSISELVNFRVYSYILLHHGYNLEGP